MGVGDYKYLIIGGTTKAGTTSLFNWLKDHPEVCAASWKETRFFLDKDYPLPSKYRFEDGCEKYEEFFKSCKNLKLRLDGTPDYLYGRYTSSYIRESLPDVKFIFSLRDPISRFVSWYRFSKQWGYISKDISIKEYLELNLKKEKRPRHLLALEQGRYSIFLKRYIETFGRDTILVIFFEDMIKGPLKIMKEICEFVGINNSFYHTYSFSKENPTIALKHPYIYNLYGKLRFTVRKFTHDKPFIHNILSFMRKKFDAIYFALDVEKKKEEVIISKKVAEFLYDYYKNEPEELEKLINRPVPWRLEKWLNQDQ